MKHNASKTRKTWTRILLVAAFAVTLSLTVGRQPFSPAKQAQAKTVSAKEYNLYFHVKAGKTKRIYVTGEDIKKVKSSNKSVLTAKLNKKKTAVVVHTKKKGTAKVIITYKDGTKSNTKYDVEHALTKEKESEIKSKLSKFNKSEAKKAFKIQNSYRAEVGVADLEWSDELYEFAKYRLKTSGFDGHKNLRRDIADYFGDFATIYSISFGENMGGGSTAQSACKGWKNSSGHYANMINSSYQCGAIAYDSANNWWVAVFAREPASTFVDWQGQVEEHNNTYATVTVKVYDSASGEYLNNAPFSYYALEDNQGTTRTKKIFQTDETGKAILYLEPDGKTYEFCYYKGDTHVTLTVTGDCEVILTTD